MILKRNCHSTFIYSLTVVNWRYLTYPLFWVYWNWRIFYLFSRTVPFVPTIFVRFWICWFHLKARLLSSACFENYCNRTKNVKDTIDSVRYTQNLNPLDYHVWGELRRRVYSGGNDAFGSGEESGEARHPDGQHPEDHRRVPRPAGAGGDQWPHGIDCIFYVVCSITIIFESRRAQ